MQSLKESAGVAYYSGVNSDSELLFNQVINPVTGQITNEDIAQLNVLGEEGTTIETFSRVGLNRTTNRNWWCIQPVRICILGPVTFQKKVTSQMKSSH